jgi:carbon-monoxide dehydrogenase medium subunit
VAIIGLWLERFNPTVKDFEYAAAATVDEAVSLLSAGGERAKVLAGGTDILVQLREGLRDADLVVDIKKVPELTRIDFQLQRGLRLGAAVPCYRIYDDPKLSAAYPALADSARIIGGWQIQSRASIGGNLCNSSPAADSIPSLIAYNAICHIAGPQGTRTVPVAEFCTGPGRNVLGRGEFLVTIELPPPDKTSGAHYLRFIPRNEMDIAVVGAAAWLRLDASGKTIEAARIALGAVAATPLFAADASAAIVDKPANEQTFNQAAELARKIARPISDMRGPAEYRVHLVGVLVKRALEKACQRALQN